MSAALHHPAPRALAAGPGQPLPEVRPRWAEPFVVPSFDGGSGSNQGLRGRPRAPSRCSTLAQTRGLLEPGGERLQGCGVIAMIVIWPCSGP